MQGAGRQVPAQFGAQDRVGKEGVEGDLVGSRLGPEGDNVEQVSAVFVGIERWGERDGDDGGCRDIGRL